MDSCCIVHDQPKAALSLSAKATGSTDHRRTPARARVRAGREGTGGGLLGERSRELPPKQEQASGTGVAGDLYRVKGWPKAVSFGC